MSLRRCEKLRAARTAKKVPCSTCHVRSAGAALAFVATINLVPGKQPASAAARRTRAIIGEADGVSRVRANGDGRVEGKECCSGLTNGYEQGGKGPSHHDLLARQASARAESSAAGLASG